MKKKEIIIVMFLMTVCFLFQACPPLPDEEKIKDMPSLVLARYSKGTYFASIPYDPNNANTTQYGYFNEKNSNTAYFSIKNNSGTRFYTYLSEDDNFDYATFHDIKPANGWGVYPSGNLLPSSAPVISTISGSFGSASSGTFALKGVFSDDEYSDDLLKGNVIVYGLKTINLYVEGTTDAEKNDIISYAQKTFRQAVCNVKFVDYNSANCIITFGNYSSGNYVGKEFTVENTKKVVINTVYNNNKVSTKNALVAIAMRFGLGRPNAYLDTLNLMNTNYGYTHLNPTQWGTLNSNVR